MNQSSARLRNLWRIWLFELGLLLLMVAILPLKACAASGTEDSPYNPPATIEIRSGFVLKKVTLTARKIPALLFAQEDTTPVKKPIVIALHGGGMPEVLDAPGMTAKEAWFIPEEFHDVPYILAEAGCIVVIFDAYWAGERFLPEYREVARENPFNAAVKGWTETAGDVSLVIDVLSAFPDADTTRVGLCGRSGGAITALMAARKDARVATVVSWAGCADVEAFLRAKAPAEVAEQLLSTAPDVRKRLQEFDPVYDLRALPPRAILLMNNRTDPAVPSSLVEVFYQALLPLYGDNDERLQLHLRDTPEPTHKMSAQDYADGCAWLIRNLTGTAP